MPQTEFRCWNCNRLRPLELFARKRQWRSYCVDCEDRRDEAMKKVREERRKMVQNAD